MLDEHRRAEGHVRVDVVGHRKAEIDRLQVGLQAAVATHPAVVVVGLEAERRGQRYTEVGLFADRHMEVSGRNRRDHAGVAAVTAGLRGTGRLAAGAFEFGLEADGAQVALEHAAIELAHAGRVGGDDRGITLGTARAGEGTAEALGTLFRQLERGCVRIGGSQYAGDADGQHRNAGKSRSGLHRFISPESGCLLCMRLRARWAEARRDAPDSPPDIRRRMRVLPKRVNETITDRVLFQVQI